MVGHLAISCQLLPTEAHQWHPGAAGGDTCICGRVTKARACRVCGCTEADACLDEMGDPCGWAENMGDLCTSCVVPLELCTGDTPECPHIYCPDGWHTGDDLPCSCTPSCAATEDE